MGKIKNKVEFILKHNKIINKAYVLFGSLFFKFIGLFVKTNNYLILFTSLNMGYNDSPKAIYEEMIKNDEFKKFTYVWAVKNIENSQIPGPCSIVKADTLKYFILSLKAKYWISSVNIERGLKYKKKKTIYLNTWHGIPIKKIGNAAKGRVNYNFSHIDFFCSSSEFENEIYSKDLLVNKTNIILSGMPRNDELYSITKNDMTTIKQKLNLPLDKKIILYAPTWRDSIDSGNSYSGLLNLNIEMWKEMLGSEYILLLRSHHYTTSKFDLINDDFVYDFSDYKSINELLKISDILISDYSATIFDYAILERPFYIFAYDLDSYLLNRGTYIDIKNEFNEVFVDNENDLIKKIKSIDYVRTCDFTRKIKNKYICYGGNATNICISKLFKKEQ